MNPWILVAAAALLSLERVSYVRIARARPPGRGERSLPGPLRAHGEGRAAAAVVGQPRFGSTARSCPFWPRAEWNLQ
jgi:hypothetical protein